MTEKLGVYLDDGSFITLDRPDESPFDDPWVPALRGAFNSTLLSGKHGNDRVYVPAERVLLTMVMKDREAGSSPSAEGLLDDQAEIITAQARVIRAQIETIEGQQQTIEDLYDVLECIRDDDWQETTWGPRDIARHGLENGGPRPDLHFGEQT